MKKAIEKAIENGFITTHEVTRGEIPLNTDMGVYFLVFGTDFIDKLVGDGKAFYYCKKNTFRYNRGCVQDQCDCDEGWENCEHRISIYIDTADYHRQKLSNIKDIEKIKEYVDGLVWEA